MTDDTSGDAIRARVDNWEHYVTRRAPGDPDLGHEEPDQEPADDAARRPSVPAGPAPGPRQMPVPQKALVSARDLTGYRPVSHGTGREDAHAGGRRSRDIDRTGAPGKPTRAMRNDDLDLRVPWRTRVRASDVVLAVLTGLSVIGASVLLLRLIP